MGLIVSDQGGGSFGLIPQGMHQGICHAIYDLGEQFNSYYNNYSNKILLVFELPHIRGDFEEHGQTVNKPRVVSNRYTASLGKKANLRKMLESWRGRAFTNEELEGFDLGNILGINCQVQIIHEPDREDPNKMYSNIQNVLPMSQGMQDVKPENELVKFEMGQQLPPNIPEWIQKIIMKSTEMAGRQQQPQQQGGYQQPQQQQLGGYQQHPPQQQAPQEDLGPAFPSESTGMDEIPF